MLLVQKGKTYLCSQVLDSKEFSPFESIIYLNSESIYRKISQLLNTDSTKDERFILNTILINKVYLLINDCKSFGLLTGLILLSKDNSLFTTIEILSKKFNLSASDTKEILAQLEMLQLIKIHDNSILEIELNKFLTATD